MQTLLSYPPEMILAVIVALLAVIYSCLKAYAWLKEYFLGVERERQLRMSIPQRVTKLEQENDKQTQQIDLLIQAARSDIKSELVKQCQYFERQGYIDWHSRDVLYQQFEIYKKMNGNSWAKDIIDKIKKIPSEEEYFNLHPKDDDIDF